MKNKLKYLILIAIIFTNCQNNREKKITIENSDIRSFISDSLKYIIEGPSLKLSRDGCTRMPKNLETILIIREKATKKEIERLSKHSNPQVKCYAFTALRDRKYSIFSTLFELVNDTSKIINSFGCLSDRTTVGEFCFWKIWKKDSSEEIDTCYLKENEIDSLIYYILKTDFNKRFISNILTNRKLSEKYYPLIKKRANINSEPAYLVALARFQKSDDKRFIQNILKNFSIDYSLKYKIIEVFPHIDFHKYLEKIADSLISINRLEYDIWGFYKANSKYPGEIAIPLYRKALHYTFQTHFNRLPENWPSENNGERSMIVGILKKSNDKLLKNFRNKLINQMTNEGFEYMIELNPDYE